jgi:hypothetical protein
MRSRSMTWWSKHRAALRLVLAKLAIRCRFVDRFGGPESPPLCQVNGSLLVAPSLRLPVPASPVPRLHRDRVVDHPLLIKTIRLVPIVALSDAELIVQCQIKQRQFCLVDLNRINVHRRTPCTSDRSLESAAASIKHADRLTLTIEVAQAGYVWPRWR